MPGSFICDECGQALSSASNLKQHRLTHTGEKPYQCEVCNRRFSRAGSLTRHMRTHTGEKPFQCEVCGKGFKSQGNRAQHMRIHTGVRPYMCEKCGRSFNQSAHLKRHKKKGKLCWQEDPSESATQSVAVHTHTEPVGMVTVTTQTRVSSGYTTTISTVTSPIGSAYVVTKYSSSATTTTATQASGLVTTNTDPNLPGSGSGSIPENASTAEPSSMHDYNTDDSSDDIDVVN